MDEKLRQEFVQMLKEARGTPQEWAVIMAMVDMLEDEEEFEELAKLHKGVAEYKNYLTEKEAKKIAEHFLNYDGTRGAKWSSPVMFDAIDKLGGHKEEKGKYNQWAMFVLMNMIHSDYGGVLLSLVQGESYAKVCYMMAVAWSTDPDRRENVREYFGLE